MDKIEQANEGKILGTKTTKFLWYCNAVACKFSIYGENGEKGAPREKARVRGEPARYVKVATRDPPPPPNGEIWSQANDFYTWALQD